MESKGPLESGTGALEKLSDTLRGTAEHTGIYFHVYHRRRRHSYLDSYLDYMSLNDFEQRLLEMKQAAYTGL